MTLRRACSTSYAMLLEGKDDEAREEIDEVLSDGEGAEGGIDGATMRMMKFNNASNAMVAAGGA